MSLAVLTQRFRNLWQPRKGLAIAEASIIGLVAALSAVFLKVGSGWLGTWRVHRVLRFYQHGLPYHFSVWVLDFSRVG